MSMVKTAGARKKYFVFVLCMLCIILLTGCVSEMKDGFYTAEMSDLSYGWREYLCIMVKDHKIAYAEFNAKDPSGYIKAWDNDYMENMAPVSGTYPNEYTREYVAQLIEAQSADGIDTISGATSSGKNFQKMAEAVTKQAVKGDENTVVVQSEAEEE